MSNSRLGGEVVICLARAINLSVEPPIAETTMQMRLPLRAVWAIRFATRSSLAISATELPPYF